MTNITHFPVAAQTIPQGVVALSCLDAVHFDPGPLQSLYARKPANEADDIICRLLEDIAVRLDLLQGGLAARDFDLMQRPARRIALVAKHMGLLEVVTAAGHVRACLWQDDGIALEATIARLERGFDVAVNEIWSFRD